MTTPYFVCSCRVGQSSRGKGSLMLLESVEELDMSLWKDLWKVVVVNVDGDAQDPPVLVLYQGGQPGI